MLTAIALLTFNFWGLPDVGTLKLVLLRDERSAALCSVIKTMVTNQKLDVLALQEVWVPQDRETLKHCGLDYSVDLNDPQLLVDNGLMILSRFPLAPGSTPSKVIYEKPPASSITRFDGESSANKSVIVARFQTSSGKTFVVANTHLVSSYTHYPEFDRYEALRNQEFGVAEKTLQNYRMTETEPAFLIGDFNTGPKVDGRDNPTWRTLTQRLDYDRNQEATCTVCTINPFQDGTNERMDFILSIPSPNLKRISENRLIDTTYPLLPNFNGYLSDHFAWAANYQISN